jgi:thymidylate synthase
MELFPYFAANLTFGDPCASTAVCLLWTPQERVVAALPRHAYVVVGNLYSREGISFLVRNVLAYPRIRTLVLCGRDMTGSGAALVALMRDGVDDAGRIVGDGTRLHPELPLAAINALRDGVHLIDARDTIKPEAIAALLTAQPHNPQPFLPEPLHFPYHEPQATHLPAEESGWLVRARTIQQGYLAVLWRVLTFGQRTGTQHSADQQELLDVMTVITDEATQVAQFSYADWMPFSAAELGTQQPDGRYTGYLAQFLQAGRGGDGVSYTYGDRLRAFPQPDPVDQVAAIVADLRASGQSRRAVASLWAVGHDAAAPNPPCLVLVQARLRPDPLCPTQPHRLTLTAYFRSHDIYRAWAMNAFGLRALHSLLAAQISTPAQPVVAADLVIISHSAHVYAHDWAAAQRMIEQHYQPTNPRLVRDPRGSFVIRLEPPEIMVQHFSPQGEHLRSVRGSDAAHLSKQLAAYLSDPAHALYLGQELAKAELALRLDCPQAYHQDRALDISHLHPKQEQHDY